MRRLSLLISLIPLVFAACATKPAATPVEPVRTTTAQSTTASTGTPAPQVAAAAPQSLPEHLDPNSPLNREHSVYFKFDDDTVGADAKAVVERHGEYLSHHPSVQAAVQGNTDERGGAEYNLALGQRRAEAVKTALKVYGAKDSQVEATSYGSEKPMAKGHDEDAWRQNRRADIVYAR